MLRAIDHRRSKRSSVREPLFAKPARRWAWWFQNRSNASCLRVEFEQRSFDAGGFLRCDPREGGLKLGKNGCGHVACVSDRTMRLRSYMASGTVSFALRTPRRSPNVFSKSDGRASRWPRPEGFRWARTLHPFEPSTTRFFRVYFSPECLQGLLSPQYLIELAVGWMQSGNRTSRWVHLARAAAGIRVVQETIRPTSAQRSRGWSRQDFSGGIRRAGRPAAACSRSASGARIHADGARGTFYDSGTAVSTITDDESGLVWRNSPAYAGQFGVLDPTSSRVRRGRLDSRARKKMKPAAGNTEATRAGVFIHAEIAPLATENYVSWAKTARPADAGFDPVCTRRHHRPCGSPWPATCSGPPTTCFAGNKDSKTRRNRRRSMILGTIRLLKTVAGEPRWRGPFRGCYDRSAAGHRRGQRSLPKHDPGCSGVLCTVTTGDANSSILSFQTRPAQRPPSVNSPPRRSDSAAAACSHREPAWAV